MPRREEKIQQQDKCTSATWRRLLRSYCSLLPRGYDCTSAGFYLPNMKPKVLIVRDLHRRVTLPTHFLLGPCADNADIFGNIPTAIFLVLLQNNESQPNQLFAGLCRHSQKKLYFPHTHNYTRLTLFFPFFS